MNGKSSFKKSFHRAQRQPPTPKSIKIGDWRLQENEEGDLVVYNVQTQATTILISKELPEEGGTSWQE